MTGPGVPMGGVEGRPLGTLTTRPLTFSGRYLFVNANIRQGDLRAETLDADNCVIEPFSVANCVPVKTDGTKHAVVWKQGADIKSLAGTR